MKTDRRIDGWYKVQLLDGEWTVASWCNDDGRWTTVDFITDDEGIQLIGDYISCAANYKVHKPENYKP